MTTSATTAASARQLRVVSYGGIRSLPRKRLSRADRFWARVDVRGRDACWPWKGVPNKKGYGRFCFERRIDMAHRVAYELTYGPLGPDKCACHNCPTGDNPLCCNPRHLWAGTKAANNADMRAKGRGHNPPARRNRGTFTRGITQGENHPRARLTWADVSAIRNQLAAGASGTFLACQYGVSRTVIHHIKRNLLWKEEYAPWNN